MRILHVIPTYLPAYRYGGPIYSVHGLCKSLVKRGHAVDVFTTNVDGPYNSDVPTGVPVLVDGVQVYYFKSEFMRRLYFSPQMAMALFKQVKKYDVIHLHSIYLWPTWAAAKCAIRFNIPYIVSPRGMLIKNLIKNKNRMIKTSWIRLIERRNLEKAAGIHVTSPLEADEVRRFNFRLPDITIIPNGFDVEIDRLFEDTDSSKIDDIIENMTFILFLGRINWKKGLDRLVQALNYIPSHICLIVTGNDEENYQFVIEDLAVKAGVSERIFFTGAIYGKMKTVLFQKALAMVLPSYSENFGNTVLEAMACGCPVVVTPEVGLSDVVETSGAGWVVDGDPSIFGNALKKLLADKALRFKMGENGKKTVQEQFVWQAVSEQMEKMYAGL
ncbi:glycosyltransferase [Desulfococcaceae bacterium HSG9]|nr:glycosyltransferase [Desulfococcaceae bacterium HSG9]